MSSHNHDHHNHHNAAGMSTTTTTVIPNTMSPAMAAAGAMGDDHSSHHMDHGSMDHSSHGSMEMNGMKMNGSGGGGGMSMMHGMKMYFHFGDDEVILFSFWKISTVGGLIGSIFGIFLMAALYEGLKVLREYLHQREIERQTIIANSRRQANENGVNGDNKSRASGFSGRCEPFSVAHVIQTILHLVQIIVSYMLMLIFMTYNVWLCAAVALGAAFGYFVFGWRRRITIADAYEHCH